MIDVFPLTAAFELLNIFREAAGIKADKKKQKNEEGWKQGHERGKEGGREREKESETDQMKGGDGKERAKTKDQG